MQVKHENCGETPVPLTPPVVITEIWMQSKNRRRWRERRKQRENQPHRKEGSGWFCLLISTEEMDSERKAHLKFYLPVPSFVIHEIFTRVSSWAGFSWKHSSPHGMLALSIPTALNFIFINHCILFKNYVINLNFNRTKFGGYPRAISIKMVLNSNYSI